MLDGDASATPVDPMGRLPLYCAERRPRECAVRRIEAVCAAICAVVSRRLDRRGTCRHVARRERRNAESGGDRRTRYRASTVAKRASGYAWCLSRAHNDSGGTLRCDDGVVNPAARDDDASCTV
ncbi:hypothetical protein [Burkholderia ambifaria]|uniref:hypothetical protein n=1 Tax=Burkholderia ambifaria TaxID=152480 RepID=UPI0011B1DF3D|nr:hypothetical protein [Burkholderia ambifaria]